MRQQKYILPGQFGYGIMPHSEVCMHMKVAGNRMLFQLLENGLMVQLYDNFNIFSAPITTGEAGVYTIQVPAIGDEPESRQYWYHAETPQYDKLAKLLIDLSAFCREVEASSTHGRISTDLARRAVALQGQLCLK